MAKVAVKKSAKITVGASCFTCEMAEHTHYGGGQYIRCKMTGAKIPVVPECNRNPNQDDERFRISATGEWLFMPESCPRSFFRGK